MGDTDVQIHFDAPAVLRKWPSLNKERIKKSWGATLYVVADGTLDECIREFMSRPASQHHLYEIHTAPQETSARFCRPSTSLNSPGCGIFSKSQISRSSLCALTKTS
jgi:hypothetical protein